MAQNTEQILLKVGMDLASINSKTAELLKRQQTAANTIKSVWQGVGNFISGAAILGGLNAVINKFDELQDRADNLGVGTDFLQGMGGVANQNAVGGINTFNKSITELSAKLGEAKDGGEQAITTFAKYGITLAEIQRLNTEEMFYLIADRIKAIPDPAMRTNAAFELLGKSGKNLTGVLSGGSDELKKMSDAISKLDTVKIKQLAEAKDIIEQTNTTLTVWAGRMLGGYINIAEYLGKLSAIYGIGSKIKDVYDSNDAAQILKLTKESAKAWRDNYTQRMSAKASEASASQLVISSLNSEIEATRRLASARHAAYLEKIKDVRSSLIGDYSSRKEFPTIAEIAGAENMSAIDAESANLRKSPSRLSAVAAALERAKMDEREARRQGWAQRANSSMLEADRLYGILQNYGAVAPKERLSDVVAKLELTNNHLANLSVTIKGVE